MSNLSAKDVLNGAKFKLHQEIEVSPDKKFTVVDASISVSPVSGEINIHLTVDYVFGDKTGTDVIKSTQLKEFLK